MASTSASSSKQNGTAATADQAAAKPSAGKASGGTAVPVSRGQEHGYIGAVHPDKNRDDYTVTGDEPTQPSVDERRGWAPVTPS